MSIKERYGHLPRLSPETVCRLDSLEPLLRDHPIKLAYVFGSLACADTGAEAEDVDLAVLPEDGFSWSELYSELSQHLRTDRLDLVDLRVAPITMQFEVTRTGRCLFARSEEERQQYEQRVRMKLRDELPRIRARTRALRARLSQ